MSPRIQWDDAGGYCGSMSIQEVALGKGVWLSQQKVRDNAAPGGGHDSEILATNVEDALRKLKFDFEAFDYKTLPTPQADAYRKWLKRMLVAGHGVFWMIMLEGGHYPVYPGLPYGFYSHVEPVYGIMTDHPLDDENWYADDYIVHSTDASLQSYYRRFDSLPAGVNADNTSECGGGYLGYPCIYEMYGFGYAIKGPADGKAGPNVALTVDSSSEPDTRSGAKPSELHGTLFVSGLTVGKGYNIFRFDSVADAYEDYTKPYHGFVASNTTYSWTDRKTLLSSSATYYRALPVDGADV